jgi:hypothetical protein
MANSVRDSEGRFYGSRLDLEFVPRLPAVAVRAALEDPLRRSYLFVWKLEGRPIGGAKEVVDAVRVAVADWPCAPWPAGPFADIQRRGDLRNPSGFVRTVFRRMPRGTGVALLLVCRTCDRPRRFLYGGQNWHGHLRLFTSWCCRSCAGLRFASEGQFDSLGWGYPRPEPWNPYVFPSVEEARRFLSRADLDILKLGA